MSMGRDGKTTAELVRYSDPPTPRARDILPFPELVELFRRDYIRERIIRKAMAVCNHDPRQRLLYWSVQPNALRGERPLGQGRVCHS
jgi:hypothetical protein